VVIKAQYSGLAELPLASPYFSYPIPAGKGVEISEDNTIESNEIFLRNGAEKDTNHPRRVERGGITSVGLYDIYFGSLRQMQSSCAAIERFLVSEPGS
jgi:hypothetical protein